MSFKNFPLRDETAVGTGSVSVLDTTELLDEDHGYPDYPGIIKQIKFVYIKKCTIYQVVSRYLTFKLDMFLSYPDREIQSWELLRWKFIKPIS